MTLPDQPQENRRLLAVDDDSMILALYQKLFVDGEAVDSSSRVGSTLLELTSIVSEVVTESATEAAVSCQRYPYQLTLCSQGGEAVEVVRKAVVAGEPYAVALIDMRMPPGIDGLETARQIRQLDKSLQLIFITAYSDHTIDNICDDVGGQILFFHKPLQTEELYQTVRNSCWSWNQSHELSQLKSDLEARIELQTEQLRDRIRSTDLLHQSAVTREQRISILTHRNRHLQAYQDLHQILSVELLPEPKTGQQLAEAIEQAEGTVSLLLVDESATTQEIYRSGLETMGFAVRGVGDIESAMVAALENPPELALINYHLSGTNGDQLIARLRDNPRTMQVLPILFSDSDDELSVVDTGAVSWLHKEQGVPMLLKRLGLVRDYLLEQRTRDLLEGEKHLILLYEKVMREEEGESGRRVLLVDDERENLQFLSWILEREGGDLEGELGQLVAMGTVEERPEQSEVVELPFDVVAVTQGREAVEVALKAEQMDKPFAIALIDMRMPPGIDGLETARQLRLISREIGIVITTAHNDYTLEEMRRVLGDNFSFMEKPYNAGEVYQRVVEGCSQWSATRQNLSTHQALLGLAEGMQQEIERRRETERALEQANQTKDDFLSSMSHELRTPLTTVIGYNELLKVEPEMPSQFKGMLDSSILAGKTLLQLVNDILDMSKVRAGKLELSKLPFDLGKMLSDVTDLMKLYGSERGVTVEVEVDSTAESRLDHLWVGDDLRISQVLFNLLSNAIKFSDGVGRVILRLALERESQLKDEGVGQFRFEVVDQGVGMSRQTVDRLFSPFEQADSSTSRRFGGTGLGLFISHQLVEMMGGGIRVESEEGSGSTFTVELPLIETETVAKQQGAMANGDGMEIPQLAGELLLAEDTPQIQRLTTLLIEKSGLRVDIANNGREALEQASDKRYGLILMDMQMPEMDGVEATRTLRERGVETPVVALTANVMSQHREAFQAVGGEGFLSKPIKRSALYAVLQQYFLPAEEVAPPPVLDNGLEEEGEEDLSSLIDEEMWQEFWDYLLEAEQDMESAYQQQEWERLRGTAHAIKGMGASYGEPQMTQVAEDLEKTAPSADLTLIDPPYQRLLTLLKEKNPNHTA